MTEENAEQYAESKIHRINLQCEVYYLSQNYYHSIGKINDEE